MNQLRSWEEVYLDKVIDPKDLFERIAAFKAAGKRIVTLNGSFDLLHAGHLHMIYEASQQGDCLIVALNTDQSIKEYKSSSRPIVPLVFRLQMIAALEFVDYVTWFDETNPCTILSIIQPDVHVNGSEYGANCIEASTVKKHGGRLHIVELIPDLSTSAILKKIQSSV